VRGERPRYVLTRVARKCNRRWVKVDRGYRRQGPGVQGVTVIAGADPALPAQLRKR
jgi:hypothetical protein